MRYCHVQNKKIAYSFTVSLQVLLIFIFLIIFYFSYILHVEKEAFENQINFVIEDLTKDFKYYIPNLKHKEKILSKLNEEISKLDKKTPSNITIDKKNKWYKTISIDIAISFLVGLVVYFLILTMFNYCLPVTYTLYESIFTIAFVALTEYAFLQLVTKKYIATDPNEIKYNIAKIIHDFAQKQPQPAFESDVDSALNPILNSSTNQVSPTVSKKGLSTPVIIGITMGAIGVLIMAYYIYKDNFKNDTIGLCINITLHVLILFSFLTLLFFTVIANYEKEQVKSQLFPLINNKVTKLLINFDSWWDKNVQFIPFPWKIVGNYSKIKMYDNMNPSEEVVDNNDKLRNNSIFTIITLFFILILLIIYFKYVKKRKFGLKFILNENLLIFSFVGILEFLFFWFIIKNYNPIYPQEAEIAALKSLEKVVEKL